jgi:hypothetical protein
MELDIALFGCSKCSKVGWDSSNMKRHVNSTACMHGTLMQFKGKVVYTLPTAHQNDENIETENETIPPTLPSSPAGHDGYVDELNGARLDSICLHPAQPLRPLQQSRKRGPKTESIRDILSGRIPARDEGDEARIDYIFDTPGVLESMLNAHIDDLPSVMFVRLYGSSAPNRFRSIVLLRNAVLNQRMAYEVPCDDAFDEDEAGDAETVYESTLMTRAYATDIAKYVLALAESIFLVSVPIRASHLRAKARVYGDEISNMKNAPTTKMVRAMYATMGTHISQRND